MKNFYSSISLISSFIVYTVIIIEFLRPINSTAMLAGVFIISIGGFICAVKGFNTEKARLGTIPIVLSSIAMAVAFALLLIMTALG